MLNTSKVIHCGNCGKKGHIYKNCYLPIVSFGIICVKYPDIDLNNILEKYKNNKYIFIDINKCKNIELLNSIKSNLKILMICRKHTLGFAEFIRGNYEIASYQDMKYIKYLFTIMTITEINMIKNKNFNVLWSYLWCMKDSMNYHQNEYINSNDKFIKLLNGVSLNGNIYSLDSIIKRIVPLWTEPEWGFPKGRRNFRESDIDCALREFHEETDIDIDKHQLVDIQPFHEIFTGSNNVHYKHTYYLSQTFEEIPLNKSEKNMHQNIEISNIAWLSIDDAYKKIRYYNKEKKYILNKIVNLLLVSIYNHLTQINIQNNSE